MILINDQFVKREDAKVDIEDRGYQFGDGVYEVIRVYNGKLFFMEEHFRRLKRSLNAIRLTTPYSEEDLKVKFEALVDQECITEGIVYMQITRGRAIRNHGFPVQTESVLTAYARPMDRPFDTMQSGIKACLVDDMRWLRCDIKSLNLLGNVLAKQEAIDQGCGEAVFHREDMITEGSSTNVFIIKGNKLITHPANQYILNGITRLAIIDLAEKAGTPVIEQAFTIDELFDADEAFIASTTQEITPIITIDDQVIGSGTPGFITKMFQKRLTQKIEDLI